MDSAEIFVLDPDGAPLDPIKDKPVTAIGGIGKTLGKKLKDNGFEKVCVSYWYMDFEV